MIPLLKLVLSTVDISVWCLVVSLLVSHCKSQHDVRSWATAFHVLVLAWLSLRGTFWVLTITTREHWHPAMFYLLYWLPNPLQFASFLLLPLFYGQMLSSRRAWVVHSRWITPLYITLVSSMVMFMVIWSTLRAIDERKQSKCVSAAPEDRYPRRGCYHMEFSSDAFRMITGLCFVALSIVVAAFGTKVSKLTRSQYRRFLIYQPRALAIMNCILFTVFLSKGIYQVVSVLKLWYLPDIPLKGHSDICAVNFFVFVCWDYLPTVLLLLMVVKGKGTDNPATAVAKAVLPVPRVRVGDPRSLPNYGLFLEIKKHVEAKAEAAALAQQSGLRSSQNGQSPSSEGSDELSPSPVLVNTWLRENSSSFTYSPSTTYGSYNSSTGGGYGGDSSFSGNYGYSPSPGSTLAGEVYVSPSAPSSGGQDSRKGFWRSGFWGGLRGRSDSGNASIGDSEFGLGGKGGTSGKNDDGLMGDGGFSNSDDLHGNNGNGNGFNANSNFNGKGNSNFSRNSTRSVTTAKSDTDIVHSGYEDDNDDGERREGVMGNLWRWWLKTTSGRGADAPKAEQGDTPPPLRTIVSTESSTLLRQNRGQNEPTPGEGGSAGMIYGGPSYGERQEYPLREEYPLKQDYPLKQEYPLEGDRSGGGGRVGAGGGYAEDYWGGQPHPSVVPLVAQRRSGFGAVAVEGGGWKWQGGDVEHHQLSRQMQYQHHPQHQQQYDYQRHQQHRQYQQQQHYQYKHQQQIQEAGYQRGAAGPGGGGVLAPGTISRHPLVAPLRVPMPMESPDGGHGRNNSGYTNARHNPVDHDRHSVAYNNRTIQARPGDYTATRIDGSTGRHVQPTIAAPRRKKQYW